VISRLSPLVFAAISLVSVSVPASSEAGYQYPNAAFCWKSTDGSGYCSGTMSGFRNNSDAGAYAGFVSTELSTGQTFYASVNGGFYACGVLPAYGTPTSLVNMWPTAANFRGLFEISWNSSGACTTLSLYNGSAYASF
jgi:hypothetical protein